MTGKRAGDKRGPNVNDHSVTFNVKASLLGDAPKSILRKTTLSNATPNVRAGVRDTTDRVPTDKGNNLNVQNTTQEGPKAEMYQLTSHPFTYAKVFNSNRVKNKGLEDLLEDGPCMIRTATIVLRKWSPDANLTKEDLLKLNVGLKDKLVVAISKLEDNDIPMGDLVDDTRKRVEAYSRMTGIWSGRKVDSRKRNIVFSSEMNLHYFDRDDMDLHDMDPLEDEMAQGECF
uniref:Uncharacterized protein n=1 Tax=Tanacetum cinerariifolium TaxID=118510 RepID=A0A6L2P5I8_TANCI|nr:hypothetical protein [Tanacetum cinerariifolium]